MGQCLAGVEVPDRAPCPVCGATARNPCWWHKKQADAKRVKAIADRAEAQAKRHVLKTAEGSTS